MSSNTFRTLFLEAGLATVNVTAVDDTPAARVHSNADDESGSEENIVVSKCGECVESVSVVVESGVADARAVCAADDERGRHRNTHAQRHGPRLTTHNTNNITNITQHSHLHTHLAPNARCAVAGAE